MTKSYDNLVMQIYLFFNMRLKLLFVFFLFFLLLKNSETAITNSNAAKNSAPKYTVLVIFIDDLFLLGSKVNKKSPVLLSEERDFANLVPCILRNHYIGSVRQWDIARTVGG